MEELLTTAPLFTKQHIWIERPVKGFEIEHRKMGRMAIFTFSSMAHRNVIDAAAECFANYVSQTYDQRYLVIDPTPTGQLSFNTHAIRQLIEMAQAGPNTSGRVAIIVPSMGMLRFLVEYYLRQKNIRTQPNLQVRLFPEREKGIEWVLEAFPGGR